MSQETLAKAVGVKQSSISDLETGATKEISGGTLIDICETLKIRPEWLFKNTGSMEPRPSELLTDDEVELINDYRAATGRWKVAIRHMAKLRGDAHQDEAADTMNYVLAKIATEPVPDARLGNKWTAPGRPKPDKDAP